MADVILERCFFKVIGMNVGGAWVTFFIGGLPRGFLVVGGIVVGES